MVVHLGVGVIEPRDQAPLALHVPVAVQVPPEEARELPRVLEDLGLGVDHVGVGPHVAAAVAGVHGHLGLLGGELRVLRLAGDGLEIVGVVGVVGVAAGPEEPVRVRRGGLRQHLRVHQLRLVQLLPALHGPRRAGLLVDDHPVPGVEDLRALREAVGHELRHRAGRAVVPVRQVRRVAHLVLLELRAVLDQLVPALGGGLDAGLLEHRLVVDQDEEAREVRQAEELGPVLALQAVEVRRRHLLLELVGAGEVVERPDQPVLVPALPVVVVAVHDVDDLARQGAGLHRRVVLGPRDGLVLHLAAVLLIVEGDVVLHGVGLEHPPGQVDGLVRVGGGAEPVGQERARPEQPRTRQERSSAGAAHDFPSRAPALRRPRRRGRPGRRAWPRSPR